MAKRSKLGVGESVLSDTSEDVKFGKLGRAEQGKNISGDPDETDRVTIQAWIDLYEKAFPGQLAKMAQDAKVELALSGRTKDYGEISPDSGMRKIMWMPGALQEILEIGFPSIWTNKAHMAWFLRNFPQFKAAEKY